MEEGGEALSGTELVQVISHDGEFRKAELERLLGSRAMLLNGDTEYNVVSIVGPQSSGKSTVLNEGFATNFVTMDATEGRYQVTQGVWSSVVNVDDRKLMLFDVEGCDSSERGVEGFVVEKKLALFALVLSDVLIINLWSNDVGRRTASNMTLLRSIVQLQYELFDSDQEFRKHPVRILFLLRDYDGQTPQRKVEESLQAQLVHVFDGVAKESLDTDTRNGHATSLSDLVEPGFVYLPHKTFCPAEFTATARNLRNFLPLPDFYSRGISSRDLPYFASGIWNTIRTDEKLNLPSQREQLAVYRCGRAADNIRADGLEALSSLSSEFARGEFKNPSVFDAVSGLVDEAVLEFSSELYGYDDDVVENKAGELLSELRAAGAQTFRIGVNEAKTASLSKLNVNLTNRTRLVDAWQNFARDASDIRTEESNKLRASVSLAGCGTYASWQCILDEELDRYDDEADVALVVARERILRSAKAYLEKRMLSSVEPPLEALINAGELDLWENATDLCRREWEVVGPLVEDALVNIGIEEVDDQLRLIRERLRLAIIERIRSMIGSSGVFFHRLIVTLREDLPENWATKSNYAVIVADARTRAFEKLLLFAVVRIGNLDGGIQAPVEHFTESEREDLLHDLERVETGLIRNARAEQYQRNVRITEVVVSTVTVLGMAVATAALGSSRRA
ncbi:hypothetical protein NDN08_003492 [Rhodosorus marinus]|uniref:GB1/RHD3-type G domain-containing protein n=1 Tax=Rhodosorus marinus TaxID=101924 RepID=A0AAV8UWQ8_9RHOD|nr:hypothetical protein NDN08_003492 [Rhodosorus marinus]